MNEVYLCPKNDCITDMLKHGYTIMEAREILEKSQKKVSTQDIKRIINEMVETYYSNKIWSSKDADCTYIYGIIKVKLRYDCNICIDGDIIISGEKYSEAIRILNELFPESKNIADYDRIRIQE